MLTDEVAARCLAEAWGLTGARLARLGGGLGARTWIVDDSGLSVRASPPAGQSRPRWAT